MTERSPRSVCNHPSVDESGQALDRATEQGLAAYAEARLAEVLGERRQQQSRSSDFRNWVVDPLGGGDARTVAELQALDVDSSTDMITLAPGFHAEVAADWLWGGILI